MPKNNYYTILGLSPNCLLQDIKKSYRKLALIWHPDKHSNKSEAQAKFTEIQEAYSILADSKKRMIYDTCGHQGLAMDEEVRNFAECNSQNIFYQKGFNGTNKSAFDILRDIFEENDDDDDDFFQDCNFFDLSENFKSNIKTFIEENIMSSESEEEESFFDSYTPSFMDANFFCPPTSLFDPIIPTADCSAETEFFSFFSSLDSDIQSFSRTSNTVIRNGKVRTSTKQRVQQGNTIYEEEESEEYTEQKLTRPASKNDLGPRPCKKMRNNKNISQEIIIEEEEFFEMEPQVFNKKGKKAKGNCGKQNKRAKKACKKVDEEDEDIVDNGMGFNHSNSKKNKISV